MRDHEHQEELVCPHCDSTQDDEIIAFKIAHTYATGGNRHEMTCDQCGKEFYVERIELIRYNTWAGRENFYD